MVYNLTSIVTNSTNPLNFAVGVNNVLMNGWLFTLLLIGLAVVLLGSFLWSTRDASKSIAATMFITFTLSIFLLSLNLVSPIVFFICLVGAGLSVAFLKTSD